MKYFTLVFATILVAISIQIKAQPTAPEGFNWVLVDDLSDEFNQGYLDTTIWLDFHPSWVGRIPSHFVRENVWVADGLLHLRSTSRIDSMDEVKDSLNDVWVNSACMSSIYRAAQPGWYYEARMKASDISMTSSFWFRSGDYSEIDVIEHVGTPINPSETLTEYRYGVNTHVYGKKQDQGFSIRKQYYMPTRGRDEFHVFGLWWKDPNTLWFYYNGVKVMEITPSIPFKENLRMIFDTEVFAWDGLPTIESLKDDSRNTMYVDYVRTLKLEEVIRPKKGYHNIQD
jgi:hypothetical protein